MASTDPKKDAELQSNRRTRYTENMKTLKTTLDYRMEWLKRYNDEIAAKNQGGGDTSGSDDGSGTAGLTPGNTTEEKIWNYFAQKGFTSAAVAGVMGNLMQESTLRVDAIGPETKYGRAWGIGQWLGGRLNNLKSQAAEKKVAETDLIFQLDFIWWELNGGDATTKSKLDKLYGGMEKVKSSTDYKFVVKAYEDSFERSGGSAITKRENYAKGFLDKYGNGNGSAAAGIVGGALAGSTFSPPSGNRSTYNKTKAIAAHTAGMGALQQLAGDRFSNNLDGCTMAVDKEFYKAVLIIYESMKKNNLLTGEKMLINSAYRPTDPDKGGPDYGAHGWGGAIDIGTKGKAHALSIADVCWAIGFRAIGVGGGLNSGRGFVHVDAGPPGSWSYGFGEYKGPGSIK